MKSNNALLSLLGVIFLIFISIVGMPIFNGWVISTIWNWFVPQVFNLPVLTISVAIMLSILTAILKGSGEIETTNNDITKAIGKLFGAVIGKLLAVVFAFVIKYYFL